MPNEEDAIVSVRIKKKYGIYHLCLSSGTTELGVPLQLLCEFIESAKLLLGEDAFNQLEREKKKKVTGKKTRRREPYVV